MADFLEAAQLDQVPIGTSKFVRVADKDIALFNVDGNIYAIANTCVHQGSSLSQGKLTARLLLVVVTAGALTSPRVT